MLKLAFLWHMHQPYYKNVADKSYLLPWVRLHGLKDYYGMVRILREFPNVKQNFNLVPSLLIQLQDYVSGNARETMLELSMTPAGELRESDKSYILRYFFYSNKENLIARFPRYSELLEMRGLRGTAEDMERARSRYTEQDYLDLQVLQKLAWLDEEYLEGDPEILALIEKGKNFEESDKTLLRKKELEILSSIIPEYRAAQERGQVELSTSPFYHPILPLLVSTRIAKESFAAANLPQTDFERPEDARAQIQKAIACHQELFGKAPAGCWPSEGSVSEHILPLLIEAGIQWIATDEEILMHSLEKGPIADKARWTARNLYSHYEKVSTAGSIALVFRDHVLSDLIGFSYARISAVDAAEDFMRRLYELNRRIELEEPNGPPALVSVILDGENAWEYYPRNGREFLKQLYKRLSDDAVIQTTTIQDYIASNTARPLQRLYPGSWIDHNFNIWIGHPEDNRGWEFLKEARDLIDYAVVNEPQKKEQIDSAYQEILIAEGSDWFWWFGDDHSSENDPEFDRLFRQHISNVYHFLGKPVPEALLIPIKVPRPASLIYRAPRRFVSPKLDGEVTNYFEWLTAGHYYVFDQQGTMHRSETLLKQILFGFDLENAYFRVDADSARISDLFEKGYEFQIMFLPHFILSVHRMDDASFQILLERERDDSWIIIDHHCEIAVGEIFELKIPFSDLKVSPGEAVRFRVCLSQRGVLFEEHPQSGSLQFIVPGPHFEEMDWEV
jgi:alpha-amylase/alpha-mannosidase (GH57 family)